MDKKFIEESEIIFYIIIQKALEITSTELYFEAF